MKAALIAAIVSAIVSASAATAASGWINGSRIRPGTIRISRLAPGAIIKLKGARGPRGLQGPQGATGPQGQQGEKGDTGPSSNPAQTVMIQGNCIIVRTLFYPPDLRADRQQKLCLP